MKHVSITKIYSRVILIISIAYLLSTFLLEWSNAYSVAYLILSLFVYVTCALTLLVRRLFYSNIFNLPLRGEFIFHSLSIMTSLFSIMFYIIPYINTENFAEIPKPILGSAKYFPFFYGGTIMLYWIAMVNLVIHGKREDQRRVRDIIYGGTFSSPPD